MDEDIYFYALFYLAIGAYAATVYEVKKIPKNVRLKKLHDVLPFPIAAVISVFLWVIFF